ncbi:ATP-dependent protease ATPase subunit HslU [Candidatus Cardinium hertigii]|jgi:ATP-dependent HslUV protease ATP-binding subunit HslU|uniref:ATP-dependent protease ATPase subunit HslU n=1 Tax=Candidatus Cardinium hertigii TaxID=247481 RepID=A0A3N2QBC7_9BACT|nr:ATP-dependent protease ATPase subunit HslU [Candidatus Cardinium hertigii]ROT47124.1 ATP-dependent protease ATPase subunit HslU [Candidatus Cardinium hertigii]
MSTDIYALTPKEIVKELDKYIIGQKEAKCNVAVALRNRWRRMQVAEHLKEDIVPNNILMIGPTGVGKTEIARRLAKIAKVPFVKVEASKFTEVGYVGRDVESMVRDLMERAVAMVKAEKMEELQHKAIQQVEETIIDILYPPLKVKGEADKWLDDEQNRYATRERFREKYRSGALDQQQIEIKVSKSTSPSHINSMGIGPAIDEGMIMSFQDMLNSFLPKQTKNKKVSIAEARVLLLAEEITKLIDMSAVKEEALARASSSGIIFIDEIDKIANTTQGQGPGVSREGVQRDLLPIIEGSSINTKYGVINTDHILFIGAGAFHMAKPSDLIPELQGRFPIRVTLENLSQKDFYKILDEPKSALPMQYQALLTVEGVTLNFDLEAKQEIAATAYLLNEEVENIGARRLQTVMSYLLNPILFDVPDTILPNTTITITKEMVKASLADLVQRKDLNQYIL